MVVGWYGGEVCGNECRGRRPQRPAEGSRPLPTMQRIRGGNGKVEGRACPAPTDCRKRLVDERGKGGRQLSPDGAGGAEPRPYAHPIPTAGVRGRLAAHNERRQPAKLARSCGCLPRGGKHCSLPGFAPLNRGPTLTTPQCPAPTVLPKSHKFCKKFKNYGAKRRKTP